MGFSTIKTTKKMALTLMCIVSVLLGLIFNYTSIVRASNNDKEAYTHRVLCLLSYNYAYPTVREEVDGIVAGFANNGNDIRYEITYESMDGKRFYTSDDIAQFEDYLEYKLSKGGKYDLIITADDTALGFATNHRDSIFKDVPIVFMGVNSLSDAKTAALIDNVTGVAEVPDMESNYELMKGLFPHRTKITAIVDATTTGQGEFVQFMEFIANHPEQDYQVLNTSRYSQDGIKNYLSELGENDIILYLDFLEDGEKNIYTLESASSFISEYASDVPIFRVSSANIQNGVLGGVSYSFFDAGKIAGEMGVDILSGKPVDKIDLVTDTVTNTYFEQSALDKFGIKESKLPEDAIILNRHENVITWYKENTLIANLVILIVILLIIIIVLLAAANRRNDKLINSDTLTQIPNRQFINKQIKQIASGKEPYGIIMVDLDLFKSINDTLGHIAGDEVLKELAIRLHVAAIENDSIAARIGGDEFMVLVKNASQEKCISICKQVQEIMRKPIETTKGDIPITVSMGGAVYPDDTDDSSKLFSRADKALYKTKREGRNGYCMYSEL